MATILLVDDNEELTAVHAAFLRENGHEVATAPDGAKAVRLLRLRSFDVMMTDVIMPEKEGIETIIEVRRGYPNLKIIAVSGGGRIGAEDYLAIAIRIGAHVTLAKPFSPTVLLQEIERLLGA